MTRTPGVAVKSFDAIEAALASVALPNCGVVPSRIAKLRRSARILDFIARRTPPRSHVTAREPQRIGILLQWGIGDAVLALPMIEGLARAHPGASIDLIGKPWLADLFSGESWFGATHELVPPWTRTHGKYRWWKSEWRQYARQLFALRKTHFDLLVGIRFDPREVVQLRLLNAARRCGVVGAGGKAWITDPVTVAPEDYYRSYRADYSALAIEQLTGRKQESCPRLKVDDAARAAALAKLRAAGYQGGTIVCVHNGAGNPIRQWRASSFVTVLESVRTLSPFVVLIDDGIDACGPRIDRPKSLRSTVWKSDLAGLKALLSVANVLLCCDSGVMHIGAACGCHVAAIFGPTSPQAFFPRGRAHQLIMVEPMDCRPCLDSCIYSRPICMDGITEDAVCKALQRAIVESTSV